MTKHPETGTRFEWGQSVDDFVVRTISKIEGRTIYTHEGGNWGTVDEFRDGIASGDIRNVLSPSASPASGPVCKAPEWCGLKWQASGVSSYVRPQFIANESGDNPGCDRRWCSVACAGNRDGVESIQGCEEESVPPLESKPAETCNCSDVPHVKQESCAKPPVQAKPAETGKCWCGGPLLGATLCSVHAAEAARLKAPPAQKATKAEQHAIDGFWYSNDEGKRIGPYPTADARDINSRAYLAWMTAQSGTPYAGPERLPKAKLVHSMGIEDQTLEDA